MYYIYHIPNIKIGCTANLKKRMFDQKFTNWEILEEHSDIHIASDREIQLQKEYGYRVDTRPYSINKNLHKHRKNLDYLKELGKNLFENKKGLFSMSKTKKRISCQKGGKIAGNKSFKEKKGIFGASKEQKLKWAHMGKVMSKAVLQYNKEGDFIKEYYSQAEGERNTGVKQANISSCCRGKQKTAGGFIWKFKE